MLTVSNIKAKKKIISRQEIISREGTNSTKSLIYDSLKLVSHNILEACGNFFLGKQRDYQISVPEIFDNLPKTNLKDMESFNF